MKLAIVYWSGTGNTEAMANGVADGARANGADVELIQVSGFSADKIPSYDAFAFGCPSMGAEVLEEDEFQPVWDAVKGSLSGKPVGLFGSWGWGGGAWMTDWEADAEANGITLAAPSVLCQESPDAAATEECKNLGKALTA